MEGINKDRRILTIGMQKQYVIQLTSVERLIARKRHHIVCSVISHHRKRSGSTRCGKTTFYNRGRYSPHSDDPFKSTLHAGDRYGRYGVTGQTIINKLLWKRHPMRLRRTYPSATSPSC